MDPIDNIASSLASAAVASTSIAPIMNNEINDTDNNAVKKRLKKKEILISKNIDIDKIIEIEDKNNNNNDIIDKKLVDNLNLVQNKFNQLTEQQNNNNYEFDNDKYIFPSTNDISTSTLPSPNPPGLNKFQQQLSGNWNQKIMESSSSMTFNDFDDNKYSMLNTFIDENNNNNDNNNDLATVNNIPSDISYNDDISTSKIDEVLKEIDNDYQLLRSKLVNIIKKYENNALDIKDNSNNDEMIVVKKKYWPPLLNK